jgi:hypothetical protein
MVDLIGIAEPRGDEHAAVGHEVLKAGATPGEPALQCFDRSGRMRRDVFEDEITPSLASGRLRMGGTGDDHQTGGEHGEEKRRARGVRCSHV